MTLTPNGQPQMDADEREREKNRRRKVFCVWSYSASDHEANFSIVELKITFQPIMFYVWTHSRGPFHFVGCFFISFSAIKHVLYPFGIPISFQFLGIISYIQQNAIFYFTISKFFFLSRFAFILYLFQLDWKRIVNEMSFVSCELWVMNAPTTQIHPILILNAQCSWRKLFLCSFCSGCCLLIVVR